MSMSSAYAHHTEQERTEADRSHDPLNPARGIIIGCAISAGLWAGIIALTMT